MLYREKYDAQLLANDDKCVICMNKYLDSDTLIFLPCSGYHHYHEGCINEWLKRNSICPICKQFINEQLVLTNPVSKEILKAHYENTRGNESTMTEH